MGRVMDYIVQASPTAWPGVDAVPLITRDEKSKVRSIALLVGVMLDIFRDRDQAVLLHVNMGDRGSAIRKSVLILWNCLLGLPVFLHLHAVEMEKLPRWVLWFLGFVFRRATCVIVLGERYRQWVVQEMGVKEERVQILWNGVPVDVPAARRHVHGDKPVNILFLGTLGPRKGMHDLIDALAMIPEDAPAWHMIFAGPGDIEKYRVDAKALGIADRCTFTGWLDLEASRDIVSQSDIVVLPSYHEGLPLVILEALGLGSPVIATPVGVIPEVLTDGENVIFCRPGDPDCLARSITQLLTDPALRQTLCDNGIDIYRRRFTLENFSSHLVAIWQGYTMRENRVAAPTEKHALD